MRRCPVAVAALLLVATIAHDALKDPTSHNLWPFEIVILGVLTSPVLVGWAIGRFARRALRRVRASTPSG